jgi:hypothetical protein
MIDSTAGINGLYCAQTALKKVSFLPECIAVIPNRIFMLDPDAAG